MSQKNVDLVRRLNEAFNASDMDVWSALVATNVVWRVMPDWPEQGPFIGRMPYCVRFGNFANPGTPTPLCRSATTSTLATRLS
jgi:ketosteroid isomerase-like protein